MELRTKLYNGDLYYMLKDIAVLLQLKSIRSVCRTLPRVNIKTETNGGIQEVSYISEETLIVLLCKSRSPFVDNLAKTLNLNVKDTIVKSYESCTLTSIHNAFKGEAIELQYSVGKYKVDMYFLEYKIAVECDEIHHSQHTQYDQQREQYIQKVLQCTFIRYQPYKKGFNIELVINQIFVLIKQSLLGSTINR
jgi:very-short-patch-repair endonuclease